MKPFYTILLAVCMLMPTSFIVDNFSEKAQKYIEKYKDIAISEMHRTGVPASIKLAQGMLESSWGQSELSKHANNHFGIKCGKSWTGPTHFVYDDDYKNGEKIKSCFRAFASAHESYVAHSEFLSNPKKERYALLFYFPPNDYKSWAYGLKDAGYATDPKYPQKLIKIIEQYELYNYDSGGHIPAYTQANSTQPTTEVKAYELDNNQEYQDTTSPISIESRDSESSKTVMITEQRGTENPPLFDKQSSPSTRKKTQQRPSRSLTDVFNNKSKKRSQEAPKYHIVGTGETMKTIARKYSIPTLLLYSKNRMPLGTQPLTGEKIQLKGQVRIGDRPEFEYRSQVASSEFVF